LFLKEKNICIQHRALQLHISLFFFVCVGVIVVFA